MADGNTWQKANGRMEVTDRPKRGEKREGEEATAHRGPDE